MNQVTKNEGGKMSKKIESINVFFSEEIEKIFTEEEDPEYKVFKATSKLLSESIDAIIKLGEFTAEKLEEDTMHMTDHEHYDPNQYRTLEGDLVSLQELLTYLLDNRDKKNRYAAILPNNIDEIIEKPFMMFHTRKFRKSHIINPG